MAKKAIRPKKQMFRYKGPAAGSVLLVGDFTNWQQSPVPMERGEDGTWTATVALRPGTHTYRFIVDGDWRDDPECSVRVPNAFGSQDMVRKVA
jgi:1,4-alpha-glucan branching enzyme